MQPDTITLIAQKAELPKQAISEAMEWLVLTWSGEESTAEQHALQTNITHWRNADITHEQAWQYMSKLNGMLAAVPRDLAANSLRSANQTSSRRQALQTFALLIVGVSVGTTVGPRLYRSDFSQTMLADISTQLGEIRPHTLVDGTELILNTDTAINIDYNAMHRRVQLVAGEFKVKTSADHLTTTQRNSLPFLVTTHDGEIRPIGTEFTVRRTNEYTLVTVQAGQVLITNKQGQKLQLNNGESASFTADKIEKITNNNLNASAWAKGKLVVAQMRLDDFLVELQRYRRGVIRTEPAVRSLAISGTFDINDAEHTLTVLEQALPIQLSFVSKYWLTVKAE
jgi:transmembrane sensor